MCSVGSADEEEGRSFCDFEIIKKSPMWSTYMSKLPVVIVYVPFFEIVERLTVEEMVLLKRNVRAVIGNEKLIEKYRENEVWHNLKLNLVDSVFQQKQAKWLQREKVLPRNQSLMIKPNLQLHLKRTIKAVGVEEAMDLRKKVNSVRSSAAFKPMIPSSLKKEGETTKLPLLNRRANQRSLVA